MQQVNQLGEPIVPFREYALSETNNTLITPPIVLFDVTPADLKDGTIVAFDVTFDDPEELLIKSQLPPLAHTKSK